MTPLMSNYLQQHCIKDLDYMVRSLQEAWNCHASPPDIRVMVARKAGLILAAKSMWQESLDFLEGAVHTLPNVTPRSLGRGDQEYHLSKFSNLAAVTVSIAFQAGKEAAFCPRLLELSRGIIMGLAIDCRGDISELKSNHPEMYLKFHRLRTQIDAPLVIVEEQDYTPKNLQERHDRHRGHAVSELRELDDKPTYLQERRRRDHDIQEMEKMLASIRKLPGFEGLQLPPDPSELMGMASGGPIVVLNSTKFRSDAIIVTCSAIRSLELPLLEYTTVQEKMSQMAKIVEGRNSTYAERNQNMNKLLLWLWDVAVEPVLNTLRLPEVVGGRTSSGNYNNLPRIWWIGVGPLARAPFHAAGDHTRGSTRNTISRAISSYIPTIKALAYAREKKLELLNVMKPRLLLVTMSTTPSEDPSKSPLHLPGATKEAKIIADIAKDKATVTSLDRPSTAQVLEILPSYNAVHFACHGWSDSQNPSESHLLLCKKDTSSTESGALDKLTVGDISNTNLKHAQIAYLSACCTAQNASKSFKLADESIYVASGFQLAGFSHVLATQWVSNDSACLAVAGDFYTALFNQSGNEDHHRVSAAFHCAVKNLRDMNLKQPIKWACYIHTGA